MFLPGRAPAAGASRTGCSGKRRLRGFRISGNGGGGGRGWTAGTGSASPAAATAAAVLLIPSVVDYSALVPVKEKKRNQSNDQIKTMAKLALSYHLGKQIYGC